MILKIFVLLIISINLGLPLNNKLDLIFLLISISLLFLSPNKNFFNFLFQNKKYIYVILSITLINHFIPKFNIQELHQVFTNKNDLNLISRILPGELKKNIYTDFEKNFDFDRLLKSHRWDDDPINGNIKNIEKSYAYSVDSFFQKNKFTRKNDNINFKSREELRLGIINSHEYGFLYDKEFRRILPYIVLFELDNKFENSIVCSKGNLYIAETNVDIKLNNIQNLNFIKKDLKECFKLKFNNKYIVLFGYSINENDNLEIKLDNNYSIKIIKSLKYFLSFIIIFILFSIFYDKKRLFDVSIYLISVISTIILVFIRDPDLFLGLRYFRGGADGLVHYEFGRNIVRLLNNSQFMLALEGGEKIFYFMPGLRYFSAINNIFFGETTFGYLIACSLIPILIYKIFKRLINKKIALILFTSFIFLPIFENMGFGYFNYIWQFARHHAESLSILLLLYGLYLIICIKDQDYSNKCVFIVGLMLSLSVFLRPNFIPTSIILFICTSILLYKHKEINKLGILILGYSLIFICLIHNIFFGNKVIFLTDAGVNFQLDIYSFFSGLISFLKGNFTNDNYLILKNQASIWNPLYNIHRIIILLFIIISVLIKKNNILIYSLFLSLACQHGLLLLSFPGSRHAYLAWLLTFILFCYLLSKTKINFLNRSSS